jgi:hypothetical protein
LRASVRTAREVGGECLGVLQGGRSKENGGMVLFQDIAGKVQAIEKPASSIE